MNTKVNMSDMAIVQPTEQPRTSPPASRGSEHMSLHSSCVRLPECSISRVMATGGGKIIEIGFVRSKIRLAWAGELELGSYSYRSSDAMILR